MQAYEQIRPITEQEKQILPDIYAILGTVYFVKLLVFYLENDMKITEDEIIYFEKLININTTQLEW